MSSVEAVIWQTNVDSRPFHRSWRGRDARAATWLVYTLRCPNWHQFEIESVTADTRIDLDRAAGSATVRQAWGGSIEKVTEAWAAGEIAEATFLATVEEWGWAQDTIGEPGRKQNDQD